MASEIVFQATKIVQRKCPQRVSCLGQRISSASQAVFHAIERRLSPNLVISACMISSAVCLQMLDHPLPAYFFFGCGAGMAFAQKMVRIDPWYFSAGY